MFMMKFPKAGVATVVAITMALAGCATPNGRQDKVAADGDGSDCNPAIAAGVGAIVGGLIAGSNDRARGAALGAGLAALACVAVSYSSSQVKSSQQVNDEYRMRTGSELPAEATVTRFDTRLDPSGQVRSGVPITMNSYIEVAQGTRAQSPLIEQEVVLYDPNGKEVTRTRKRANSNGAAGGFNTAFKFQMPEGVLQGVYPIRTAVYIDGKQRGQKQGYLQIVLNVVQDPVLASSSYARQ